MRRRLLMSLVAVALSAGLGGLWVRGYLSTPLNVPEGGYRLDVPPGSSWSAIVQRLEADGIASATLVLRAYGRWTGQAGRIQAGEYNLIRGVTPVSLLEQLAAGRVILHRLTLVEGWSVRDILRTVAADPALRKVLRARSDGPGSPDPARDLAAELDLPWPSAEGAFLPETYVFARGTTDRELLIRAHTALTDKLAAAWAGRRPDLPLATPYELLILASIVERETALPAERPEIAGVFIRRLQRGMRLQTDPTVIYGLGPRFDGNLTRVDLETDSPWNTYTRDGLPPTPIAAPGGSAIDAAARPADGTAIFFVASGAGDGSHRFTSTLKDHEAAVRDYLAALKSRQRRQRAAH